MTNYSDYVEALEDYLAERPWGYRTPFVERLFELLADGLTPEDAMDCVEIEAWRLAAEKIRNRQVGLNSSIENTLDELREIMRDD